MVPLALEIFTDKHSRLQGDQFYRLSFFLHSSSPLIQTHKLKPRADTQGLNAPPAESLQTTSTDTGSTEYLPDRERGNQVIIVSTRK